MIDNNCLFLGIDTSNYTTSIALINEDRQVIYEARRMLTVKSGETGLQQSAAFFQHIKNIPDLFADSAVELTERLSAIAVSATPRPVEDSYMPVFQAGVSIAELLAQLYKVPIYYTSHQEGHIAAGLYSIAVKPCTNRFFAVHLSGGTTEILSVEQRGATYATDIVGGTLDLHAGQLLDRIGVALGLGFPAGAELEQLAQHADLPIPSLAVNVIGGSFNLSGAESQAKRLHVSGVTPATLARAAEEAVACSVAEALGNVIDACGEREILFVGGVAQNRYIRRVIAERLKQYGVKLYFADGKYSGDNAYGVANIALDNYLLNIE